MFVLIGFCIILLSVFGGFSLGGGHLYALFQPLELLMIAGAAIGSFVIANNAKVIQATGRGLKNLFFGIKHNKNYNVELLSLLFEIGNKIRKDGVLSIENDVDKPTESPLFTKYPTILKDKKVMEFLCDHLRLIITGRVDTMHLETVLEMDIDTYEIESEQPIAAINRVADSLPAFGIVAAVMGVVHTMESVGLPPEELGQLIARAMVGTFLGVLFGYGFIAPLGVSMDEHRHSVIRILQAIRVMLLAISHNFAPALAVEMARKVLYSGLRPNSQELDEILKEVKANKVGETADEPA